VVGRGGKCVWSRRKKSKRLIDETERKQINNKHRKGRKRLGDDKYQIVQSKIQVDCSHSNREDVIKKRGDEEIM
jgi:hypothetical protein